MRRIGVAVAASGAVLLAIMAASAHAENVVRWVTPIPIPTWEPTIENPWGWSGRGQVYEGLAFVDTDLSLHPGLATSWTLVRPDTWRFELRKNIRFMTAPRSPSGMSFSASSGLA